VRLKGGEKVVYEGGKGMGEEKSNDLLVLLTKMSSRARDVTPRKWLWWLRGMLMTNPSNVEVEMVSKTQPQQLYHLRRGSSRRKKRPPASIEPFTPLRIFMNPSK
jgi:hypothetical protein